MFHELLEKGFLEPIDLYFADMHQPVDAGERAFLAAVMQAAREGHLCLDLDALSLPEGGIKSEWRDKVLAGQGVKSPYLVVEEERVYLEKNYRYETDILQELKRVVGPSPLPTIKADLNEEQQAAFNLVRSEKVSIIEGGPGTGKTYLITELVKSFGSDAFVILTAPTGKAAARLKEKNLRAECGTLHAILGIKSEKNLAQHRAFLQADLIVVDEASMMDAKLMRALLRSLQIGQRIVFLGDGKQLPPVGSGSLFSDLIDLVPTAHLCVSLRSDQKEILDLAASILEGKIPEPDGPLSFEAIQRFVLKERSAILTPLREGPWGVKELNQRIFDALRPSFYPIMITRNDLETGLSNGDVGVMFASGYAQFQNKRFDSIPSYELAYVLSIHKSQGSEFDHVLVLAPPGIELFGREILYTAVTRARESVALLGEKEVIAQTIQKTSCRRSGLKKRYLLNG